MVAPKPTTYEEVETLVDSGQIEVMVQEFVDDSHIRFFICDHRRTYEENEIYEVIVGL